MAHLFDSLVIRDLKFANRVFVSPMCQYSSTDGCAMTGISCTWEAARWAVLDWSLPRRRLFSRRDDHVEPLARIVRFIHEQGSVAGMPTGACWTQGEYIPAMGGARQGS
jgi:2,4-dienoyl-CoA reductase-like NADH-dependent reductase (Old Yellow Enzyme family)